MADKTNVYKTFPIPLINRLEKHFLVTATAMDEEQLEVEKRLTTWAVEFATILYHFDSRCDFKYNIKMMKTHFHAFICEKHIFLSNCSH